MTGVYRLALHFSRTFRHLRWPSAQAQKLFRLTQPFSAPFRSTGNCCKKTLQQIMEIGFFYVFALPRTWKLMDGTHLSNLARCLPKKFYRRVASYKFDGRRRDYRTFRRSAKLSLLGDVTLVLSKRRFNDPPHKIKLLVTNLPEASTSEILSHFSRRWMVEATFKELKTGLHLNWLQVSSFTKLPQIDQSEGHQFESEMTFLLGLKTYEQAFEFVFPRKHAFDGKSGGVKNIIKKAFAARL